MSSSADNNTIKLGRVTKYNHPAYKMEKKHELAQLELADILCYGFNRVFLELDAPVPNPTRYVYGDLKARSTKPYDLDVFAEDPIWENLVSLKHQKIAIEIDCEFGHGTKRQIIRDERRAKQIQEYYGIGEIFVYSCHEVVGQGYKDIIKRLHPCFTATQFLEWWGVVLKPEVMALVKKEFEDEDKK